MVFSYACNDRNAYQETFEVASTEQSTEPELFDEKKLFLRVNEPFKGDLPEIRKRRLLRVLVSYSKTNFFIDSGVPRGFEYELLQQYETFLNKSISKKYHHVKMVFIRVPFDRLLDMMRTMTNVSGDIAVACTVAKWEGSLDEKVFKTEAEV